MPAGSRRVEPTALVQDLVDKAAGLIDEQRSAITKTVQDLASTREASEQRRIWLELLAELGKQRSELTAALNKVSPRLGLPGAARERMLEYLKLRVGEVVTRQELAGVAGIDAWARRIRELRVEFGWRIASDETRDDLALGHYVLECEVPDEELCEQWRIANRIRRSGGAGKTRLLAYFQANVGKVITKEQLRYVAATLQEHPRRIRELVESGWQIDSHYDQATLRPGEYLMTNAEQLDAKGREHIKQRHRLLEKAHWRCELCGADPKVDPVRLQVHHKTPVHRNGTNDANNLVVLCDGCHAGEHATARDIVVDELRFPERERTYA